MSGRDTLFLSEYFRKRSNLAVDIKRFESATVGTATKRKYSEVEEAVKKLKIVASANKRHWQTRPGGSKNVKKRFKEGGDNHQNRNPAPDPANGACSQIIIDDDDDDDNDCCHVQLAYKMSLKLESMALFNKCLSCTSCMLEEEACVIHMLGSDKEVRMRYRDLAKVELKNYSRFKIQLFIKSKNNNKNDNSVCKLINNNKNVTTAQEDDDFDLFHYLKVKVFELEPWYPTSIGSHQPRTIQLTVQGLESESAVGQFIGQFSRLINEANTVGKFSPVNSNFNKTLLDYINEDDDDDETSSNNNDNNNNLPPSSPVVCGINGDNDKNDECKNLHHINRNKKNNNHENNNNYYGGDGKTRKRNGEDNLNCNDDDCFTTKVLVEDPSISKDGGRKERNISKSPLKSEAPSTREELPSKREARTTVDLSSPIHEDGGVLSDDGDDEGDVTILHSPSVKKKHFKKDDDDGPAVSTSPKKSNESGLPVDNFYPKIRPASSKMSPYSPTPPPPLIVLAPTSRSLQPSRKQRGAKFKCCQCQTVMDVSQTCARNMTRCKQAKMKCSACKGENDRQGKSDDNLKIDRLFMSIKSDEMDVEEDVEVYHPSDDVQGEPVKLVSYPPPPSVGRITVTSHDLMCLNPEQCLNDVCIDFYLKYLQNELLSDRDRQRTHIFSSFFYSHLTSDLGSKKHNKTDKKNNDHNSLRAIERHSKVKNWTRSVDVFSKDFLIVPINQNFHWFLAIVCFPGLCASALRLNRNIENLSRDVYTAATNNNKNNNNNNPNDKINSLTFKNANLNNKNNNKKNIKVLNEARTNENVSPTVKKTTDEVRAKVKTALDFLALYSDSSEEDEREESTTKVKEKKKQDHKSDNVDAASDEGDDVQDVKNSDNNNNNNNNNNNINNNNNNDNDNSKNKVSNAEEGKFSDADDFTDDTIKCPLIIVLDSLAGGKPRWDVSTILREYLQVEWNLKKRDGPGGVKGMDGEKIFHKMSMKGCVPQCPQQHNLYDCGSYLLLYVQSFFQKPIRNFTPPIKGLIRWFRPTDARDFRIKYKNLILRLNQEQTRLAATTSSSSSLL
ncbi:hypothetical protein HELRODRAFT_190297 [Helobdella robusta]|uniref:Ubiquitin-like protease family profile domain-containing protein n=1 Tax=Helobdella robusta TaxID=6412 RepID=T1FRV6_HELRO|nr:hypothetical protein HELRODRAFT_190297 [Helobdella robusta]ESO11099.1 hypothetical protein HELRODRAFT_190297 [Helobdella robusta]